jgi:hypothetical protein
MVAVAALSLAGIYAMPANAVHDTGEFQLDGNALTSVQPPSPNVQNDEDWDQICKAHPVTTSNPKGCTFAPGFSIPAGTTSADPSQFRTDASGSASDDIPTQGSTKDDLALSGWQWKEAKPSPPKNDISHAFAAEYEAADGDKYLFFGGDRISNNGDANIAFWFFQNSVVQVGNGPNNSCTISACSFGDGNGGPAVHKAGSVPHDPDNVGDILIVSAFTNGGTQPNIQIYEWVGAGNATKPCFTQACTLQPIPLPAGQGAACDTAGLVTGDIACALVNSPTSDQRTPWTFREADGKVADNTYKPGDFYEGGLNLSGLGLDNACFSSFLLNTRSSQSGDAILHDFTLGKFGRCGAALTTSPSAGVTEATAVSPGQSVTDTATITGTGPTNPPDPTSPPNVNFFICGPTAVDSLATCDDPNGTAVGSSKPLQGGANTTDGIATATSDAVNTANSPLLPGRYCFRATWAGDSNYPDDIADGPYTAATANTECFIVRQIATTTVTTPSDSGGVALTSPVSLGTSLYDKAVVTGTSVGGSPPGAVNFFICNPDQVTGTAGNEVCPTSGGTALSGNPRALSADANSSPPTSSVLSSPGVTANKAGVWCFRATYVPTGTTYTGSSDNSHNECVTVSPDTTTTVTTPRNAAGNAVTTVALNSDVYDYALVTGTAAGGVPTGSVNFFICTPSEVSGGAGSETCATGTGTALTGNPRALTTKAGSTTQAEATSSPAVNANQLGVWCFRATFVPGGTNAANYTGSSDNSHGECFTVTTTSTATSLQNWLPNDRVTLSTVGDAALDGTLVITLREGSCTGTVKYTEDGDPNTAGDQPINLSNTPSGSNFDTTNTTFKVTAANIAAGGVYYWRAVFTSSNPYVSSFTKCETSTLSINNNP